MSEQKYFIGLDIGTDSLGFCATDEFYNVITKNKKSLMGTRLFDGGNTALKRRTLRSNRRRLERKKERVSLLQNLFDGEIAKIDDGFFLRLKESMYHYDDKTEEQYNTLFNDVNYKDKDYHNEYKTIYHLRKTLCNGEVKDVRLLYLGIEHILKNRGHFLFDSDSVDGISEFKDVYNGLNEVLNDNFEYLKLKINEVDKLEEVLKNNKLSITAKEKEIKNLISGEKTKEQTDYIKLIIGGSVPLQKLFGEDNLEEELLKVKISFKGDYEKFVSEIQPKLDDDMILVIEVAKALYDWSLLVEILDCPNMNKDSTLSDAMIYKYETHKKDLQTLKEMVKLYIPNEYNEIFKGVKVKYNYVAYIEGFPNKDKSKYDICSCENFCKYIENKFKDIEITDNTHLEIINKIKNIKLLPKQRVKDNGVIPNQVHFMELKKILENNKDNFPFLQCVDEEFNITTSEKISSIFKYRIPYYVGVLNKHSKFSWIVRKDEKIYPWNFENVVDLEESAENFIRQMTNKCTYLKDADVLPKHSLLYSKYEVLNELNNLKLNGEPITIELKQELFNNLFMHNKKITANKLKTYLLKNSYCDKDVVVTGIDGDFKSSLESYFIFTDILGDNFDNNMVEDIILWIGLFGDESSMLLNKINSKYSNHALTEEQLKRIKYLKFKGFGRLSKEFLTEIESPNKDGEILNIINFMYETNNNLMQVLSSEYDYINMINSKNKKENSDIITLDDVRDLYCSPTIKRGIWQVVKVVQEIEKIIGYPPAKLFIETTRAEGKKVATKSRRNDLLEKYKKVKSNKEYSSIYDELSDKSMDDSKLRQKKLYLYFTQLGKCAYTGKAINLNDLNNHNLYDIEHIYPRSLTKDDSIHNNLVLVDRTANADKSDTYPISDTYRQTDLWTLWYNKNLITKEKYDRLTRTTPFEPKELQGFISRQLVETSQTSKAIANLFKNYYEGKESKVVYVKAGNVSAFRQHFDFVKVRDINDYHHAQDAYLNIVVGNIWDTKFTEKFFKTVDKTKYNLKPEKLYSFDTKKGDYFAWKAENNESLKTVKGVMESNKILFTRHASKTTGMFFDETIYKKGSGKANTDQLPTKSPTDITKQTAKLMNLDKYGSFKSIKGSYFCIVEHILKGKTACTIEYIPIYIMGKSKEENFLENYLIKDLELIDPKIIVSELKVNSLINVDGMPMHISGRSNDSLLVIGAVQLHFNLSDIKYFKKLENINNQLKTNPEYMYVFKQKNSITSRSYGKADIEITKEINLKYYDLFTNKLVSSIYNIKLSKQAKVFENNRENFEILELEQQCLFLIEVLSLFKCKSSTTDLTLIGGKGKVGILTINKNITDLKSFKIIHQSATGFYENEHIIIKDGKIVNEKGRRR